MKSYLTEFIGTFFLVLTVGLTVIGGTDFAPLAIGSALMVMVYMGGHVSGGHYNPAVSLAAMMRGRLASKELVPYWVSQIVGASAAAVIVYMIVGSTFAPAPGANASTMGALLVEFLFTFALCLVVLNSATARGPRATPSTVWPSASPSWWAHSPAVVSPAAPSTRPSESVPS